MLDGFQSPDAMPGVSVCRLSLDDCQLTLASPRRNHGNTPASGGLLRRSAGRPRCRGVGLTLALRCVLGSPVDALLGEPGAVPGAKATGLGPARVHRGGLQAAGPADVSGPFVAAIEHDLLVVRWPAEQ